MEFLYFYLFLAIKIRSNDNKLTSNNRDEKNDDDEKSKCLDNREIYDAVENLCTELKECRNNAKNADAQNDNQNAKSDQDQVTADEKNKEESSGNQGLKHQNNGEEIDVKLQSKIAEKIGLDTIKDISTLKTKHWGVVIENKDKNDNTKTIKKIDIAIELISTKSKTVISSGTEVATKTNTIVKTVIAKRKSPYKPLGADSEANKKLLRHLADLLHLNKSVKKEDIKKSETVDAKIVDLSDDEIRKNDLEMPEKFDKEFESPNGGLHILYTIANNLDFLKKKNDFKNKIDKIKGVMIYKHDNTYSDYWDKLTFDRIGDKFIDETEIFEGKLVDNFEEISEKGFLSPLGFFLENDIAQEELKSHFKTIKQIIKEIAKNKKQNIPELFKQNNKIPTIDRLIFAHAYKNTLPKIVDSNEYIKVCVCDDSFCIHPCDQIRAIKMNNDSEKTPIKTFIRIKPSSTPQTYLNSTKETLTLTKATGEALQYTLNGIFNSKSNQTKIFENIRPVLKNIIKGINSTVFCYGNTGSGKTYTMFGTEKAPGIIHNLVSAMFEYFESIQDLFEIKTFFSFFQIYNEKVFDMFTNDELCLREYNDEVIIKGLTEKEIRTEQEFRNHFLLANKNRKIASTNINEFSSRSHTVIRLDCVVDNKKAHVYLIDLAGSENNRKTGNEGMRLVESANINKSLFVLNQVVSAIIAKSSSIPYRDSKLTRVLKDSLGGNSICYILGCIEPEKKEETLKTLDFVSKSRKIICEVKGSVSAYISEKKETVYDRARKQTIQKTRQANVDFAHKKYLLKENGKCHAGLMNQNNNFDNLLKNKCGLSKDFTDKHKTNFFGDTAKNVDRQFYVKTSCKIVDNGEYKQKLTVLKSVSSCQSKRIVLGEKKLNTNHYRSDDIKSKNQDDYLSDICNINNSSNLSQSKTNKVYKKNQFDKTCTFHSQEGLLNMLNSENFIDIKKIKGIGDKRASVLLKYVKINGKITKLEQLKFIFSQKIYEKIISEFLQ